MAQKPTASKFLQVRKFPRKVLDRIDAAAKLLGITREEIVIEILRDTTRDVKDFEDKLRDERERRLARIKDAREEDLPKKG
jgi:hypothetical protein